MYRFTPPTTSYRAGLEGSLWGRITNQRGVAVVLHDDGRVTTANIAPTADADGVDKVWPGGRTYEIDDETAELLSTAGYDANLEVVA